MFFQTIHNLVNEGVMKRVKQLFSISSRSQQFVRLVFHRTFSTTTEPPKDSRRKKILRSLQKKEQQLQAKKKEVRSESFTLNLIGEIFAQAIVESLIYVVRFCIYVISATLE